MIWTWIGTLSSSDGQIGFEIDFSNGIDFGYPFENVDDERLRWAWSCVRSALFRPVFPRRFSCHQSWQTPRSLHCGDFCGHLHRLPLQLGACSPWGPLNWAGKSKSWDDGECCGVVTVWGGERKRRRGFFQGTRNCLQLLRKHKANLKQTPRQ